MRSSTLILALGFTLSAKISAAPLSELDPSMYPLFTVVSRASIATEVTNVTAGESPNHKHTSDCEHNYNANHNVTAHHTHNTSTEAKGHTTEGGKPMGNSSPYPGSDAHPHTAQAHNHTGDYRDHPSHHNTSATDATYDKMIQPRMLKADANSSHNHTSYYCTHPSHHNSTTATSTTTAGHSYDKKSVSPRVDVTLCLGDDCKHSKVVTANVNSAGELTGVDANNSKRMIHRQDTEVLYEDVARQMSGAQIAGGV